MVPSSLPLATRSSPRLGLERRLGLGLRVGLWWGLG